MLGARLRPRCFSAEDDLHIMGNAPMSAFGPVIRCLVWNIYKAKRRNWSGDFRHLVGDRDLVLLQEAVLGGPSDSLFVDSRRFQWVMARSFRGPVSGRDHGVKTGAAVNASARRYYLSPHTEPLSQTQKLLLVTEYPLQGETDTLMVLNMHAINFVPLRKYIGQLDQLGEALGGHRGPVILAGDFNTWSVQRFDLFLDVGERAGLVEANMERQSRLAHLNRHLDHVFYRDLVLRQIASLAHVTSSDHAPITATFELPAGNASDQ